MSWEPIVAGVILLCSIGAGMVLAILTLPGVWLMLLTAGILTWWQPGLFSVWTLVVCGVIALTGEVVEAVASAAGAKKFGSSAAAALASIVGGLLGAVIGSFAIPIPIVGTVVGGIVGAAGAAFGVEMLWKKKTKEEALKAAGGAAIGRAAATVIKVVIAGLVALILLIGLFVPGM